MRGFVLRHRFLFGFSAILIVALVAALLGSRRFRPPDISSIPFSEFVHQVEADRLAAVAIGQSAIELQLRSGQRLRTVPPPGYLASNPAFVTDLVRRRIEVSVRQPVSSEPGPLMRPAFIVAVLGLVGFVGYRFVAGRVPSLEGAARAAVPGTTGVTFADVAGVDEAKEEVQEIVAFLREPGRFAAIGARIPKGVLLIGAPGTGKTLLARSIAGEAGVPFLFASGADFVEMFAGVGAARVRRLFKEARRHAACIIFIDELDAVGRRRGSNSLSHEEREQTLNQLLVEMDGFQARQGIVVIAATNRPDILDPALLRPGRFDRHVTVSHPDVKGREQILRVHSRNVVLEPDVNLHAVARGTPGFSGADLANLVNEAALLAARENRSAIRQRDLEAARDRLLMGSERRSLVLSEAERVGCAYHESGHAVVAALLPAADPVHKISIVPRGRAMGVMMQLPEGDRHTYTTEQLEAQVTTLMGGRAAEELFLGRISSGASNDIERATNLAERMVCEFGMSPLGPLAFQKPGDGYAAERPHALSEDTARRVDEEIRRIVLASYERARTILDGHVPVVKSLVAALLEWETLDGDQVRKLLPETVTDALSPEP